MAREDRLPWAVIVPAVLIAAVVLLIGLPLGAVWIVNSSGCCLTSSPEDMVTFWASMIAGFLALFGMLITGVFFITAFQVHTTARNEAQHVAQKEVRDYFPGGVQAFDEKVKSAEQDITEALTKVQVRQAGASVAITREQHKTTNVAGEAQRAINRAGLEVERQLAAINRARQEAEAAAKAVQEHADRATGGPPQAKDEPEQSDE